MFPIFLSNKKCRLENVVNKLRSCLITEFLWIFSYELHSVLSNSMDMLWHSMELGTSGNPMAFHGTRRYSMEFHGIPWNSINTSWNSVELHGIPWNSMDTPWNSMAFRGTPWHSMELHGYSMDRIPSIYIDFRFTRALCVLLPLVSLHCLWHHATLRSNWAIKPLTSMLCQESGLTQRFSLFELSSSEPEELPSCLSDTAVSDKDSSEDIYMQETYVRGTTCPCLTNWC